MTLPILIVPESDARRRRTQQVPVRACAWRINIGQHHFLPSRWQVTRTTYVSTPWGTIVLWCGMKTNQATWVRNLKDRLPCLSHDNGYQYRWTKEGQELSKEDCDMLFVWLNNRSWNWTNRAFGAHRFSGVVWFGKGTWNNQKHGDPIPSCAQGHFDSLPEYQA